MSGVKRAEPVRGTGIWGVARALDGWLSCRARPGVATVGCVTYESGWRVTDGPEKPFVGDMGRASALQWLSATQQVRWKLPSRMAALLVLSGGFSCGVTAARAISPMRPWLGDCRTRMRPDPLGVVCCHIGTMDCELRAHLARRRLLNRGFPASSSSVHSEFHVQADFVNAMGVCSMSPASGVLTLTVCQSSMSMSKS